MRPHFQACPAAAIALVVSLGFVAGFLQAADESAPQKEPDKAKALYREAQRLMAEGKYDKGYAKAQEAMKAYIEKNDPLAWLLLEKIELDKVQVHVHLNMGPSERNPPDDGVIRPLFFRVWTQGQQPRLIEQIDYEIGMLEGKPNTAAFGISMPGAHGQLDSMEPDSKYSEIRAKAIELVEHRHRAS